MKNKLFKKEILPLGVAILMLLLLIGALVYTILYKPNRTINKNDKNTLSTEDLVVNNTTTTCGDYDYNKLVEDAKKVKLLYEVLDNYNLGQAMTVDRDTNGDGVVDDADVENVYGYALRIKAEGLTDNMYIQIYNKTYDYTKDYYKNEIDEKGYIYDETEYSQLQYLDVKVLINNDDCKNIILREFETTLPRFNSLKVAGSCNEDEYKDLDVCKPFIFDNDNYETQHKKLAQEINSVDKTKKKKETEKKESDEKGFLIWTIAGVVFTVAVSVAFVVVMKGSKKHEKK